VDEKMIKDLKAILKAAGFEKIAGHESGRAVTVSAGRDEAPAVPAESVKALSTEERQKVAG
jgi:hypothetical protein